MESKNPDFNGLSWIKKPQNILQINKKQIPSAKAADVKVLASKNNEQVKVDNSNVKMSDLNGSIKTSVADNNLQLNKKSEKNLNADVDKQSDASPLEKFEENKNDSNNKTKVEQTCNGKETDKLEDQPTNTIENKNASEVEIATSSKTDDTCFDLCEQVFRKIKSGDQEVLNLFENILNMFINTKDSDNRKLKLNLLEDLLNNLIQGDHNDITRIKNSFKEIFLPASLTKLIIDENDITESYGRLLGGRHLNVFVGQLKQNNRTNKVVVKLCASSYSIREEASILSQLNHPNVIKILGVDRDLTKLVLEYMEGRSVLHGILENSINLSNKNLFKILVDISTGMEYIHSQKILHRDLSLRNILFNNRNEYKICDFEFAVYVGDSDGEFLEPEKELKPRDNMSPESFMTNIYTFKSDIWSMGILCWEMFDTVSNKKMIHPILKNIIIDPIRQGLDKFCRPRLCPEVLFSYVEEKLLQVNPSNRSDFSEVKTLIQQMNY